MKFTPDGFALTGSVQSPAACGIIQVENVCQTPSPRWRWQAIKSASSPCTSSWRWGPVNASGVPDFNPSDLIGYDVYGCEVSYVRVGRVPHDAERRLQGQSQGQFQS